jgi:hypothetical protein
VTYLQFKAAIEAALRTKSGSTWKELKILARLPYRRPCPEWTQSLETEIGLDRRKGPGRELVWFLKENIPAKAYKEKAGGP